MYNRLLERQIKRKFKGEAIPEEIKELLDAINDSYEHYEADRNILERSLEVSSAELNNANAKIKDAFHEIEEKNKEIMDSINYAKGIQSSILPPDEKILKYLPESFVLFRPKDVVSGDFYWISPLQPSQREGINPPPSGELEGACYFAAADCTGHGVPGAFVSLVGANGLTRCVKEYGLREPSRILDKLTQLVEETFSARKDGMDMAFCLLIPAQNQLQFSGANNPLWVIRRGNNPLFVNGEQKEANIELDKLFLYEIKADKQPVGAFDARTNFTNNIVEIQKDDTIFVFSDGYPDQFGGDKGKKFMSKQLKHLLLEINSQTMVNQKDILNNTIVEWMKIANTEQIDDICIFGVKI